MELHLTRKVLYNKGNHQQNEKNLRRENIFVYDTSDKGLIARIHKKNFIKRRVWAKMEAKVETLSYLAQPKG